MAVGQVIGRVSVKVLPDTSDFRRDLKPKLERIEEQTKPLKIKATFDATGLKSEILKSVRELNAEMKTRDAYKIKFRAGISTVGMRGEVRDAMRRLKAEAALQDKINFKAGAISALAEVELDRKALSKVERELDHWRRKVSPLNIAVVPDIANGVPSYINARLRFLTRPRSVEITPQLNPAGVSSVATALAALSGGRVLSNMLDDMWSKLKRLDKAVPIIGTVAEAIAGLGAWGLTAGSNLFALSASLASIGPAALALPGIFGGLAIGVTAFAVAIKDFNKYIPSFAIGMGRTAKAGVAWKHLQDSMSSKFWKQAAQPVRELINTLFPQFAKGMVSISSQLGGFTGKLATAFKGVFNGELAGMFRDLGDSIKVMSGYTGVFASIIKTLGSVGAGYLPKLAKWFGDISTRFDNFITKAANDGSLTQWIDDGIFQLKELGRALGNLGGILNGISDAALKAGGSTLTMFADTLQSIETTVKGMTFQTNLTATLAAAHTAMSDIADKAGPAFSDFMLKLSQVVQHVFPLMGDTIGTAIGAIAKALAQKGVGDGLIAMFSGLQSAVHALAPSMGPLGLALGALMTIIGSLATVIGPVIATALTALSNALVTIQPNVSQLITLLGGGLLAIVKTLAPIVDALASSLANVLSGPLVSGLGGIIGAIAGPLASLGQTVQKMLPQIASALAPFITGIGKILGAVLPVLIDGINQVLVAIAPLLPYLGQLGQILGTVLPPILKIVAEILVSSIVGAVKGAVMVITGLIDVFTGLWNFISGVFTGNWSQAWEGIKQVLSGVLNAIGGAILVFLNVGVLGAFRKGFLLIKGLWGAGWESLGTLGAALWDSIRGRFVAFLRTLVSTPRAALGAIKALFSGAWGDIKAAAQLAFELIPGVVRGALGRLGSAVANGIAHPIQTMRSLPGKLINALGNLGSILYNAGRSVIQGFINGIGSMVGAVKGKLQGITNKLTSWKGPPKTDATILIKAGQLVMEGFIKGIASREDKVKKTLQDLTSMIPGTASKASRNHLIALRKALLGQLGLYDSLSAKIDAAKNALAALQQQQADYAAQVAGNIVSMGDPTGLDGADFPSIIEKLTQARDQALAFADVLKQLQGLKLNSTTFDQLAQAGPMAALAAAQAIAQSGQAGVDQINALQSQLSNAANAVGNTAAQVMFQNGIYMAQGLVKGLQSQQAQIVAQMTTVAEAMVRAIKKALGIHSPSRVFKEIGGNVGQGFINGVDAMQTKAAGAIRKLGATTPDIAKFVDQGLNGSVAGNGTTKVINYYAAPGTSLDSEESLFSALDRARSNGF